MTQPNQQAGPDADDAADEQLLAEKELGKPIVGNDLSVDVLTSAETLGDWFIAKCQEVERQKRALEARRPPPVSSP